MRKLAKHAIIAFGAGFLVMQAIWVRGYLSVAEDPLSLAGIRWPFILMVDVLSGFSTAGLTLWIHVFSRHGQPVAKSFVFAGIMTAATFALAGLWWATMQRL